MWPFKKKKFKPKPYPDHLIYNFDDGVDYIGIGMAFIRNKKHCRVAIRLENDFTAQELKDGILRLAREIPLCEGDPMGGGVLYDDNSQLTGKEIRIRCQEE